MATRKPQPSVPTAADVPVTRAMLAGVRTELLERIDLARAETAGVKAEVGGLRAEIAGVKAELKAEINEVKAAVARIEVLVEEQNARNQIVLDGITTLLSRQNQVEQRVTDVEDTVRKLASTRAS